MGSAFHLSIAAYLIARRSLLFENSCHDVANTHSTIFSAINDVMASGESQSSDIKKYRNALAQARETISQLLSENQKLNRSTPIAISGMSFDLFNWAISNGAANTFKLQGSNDNSIWTDLSAAVASTAKEEKDLL